MIHLFEYILVSCLVYNPFTNVTLEDIYKQLHILGGSLKGHCEQNPWSDDKNYHKSQAVVDINMLDLFTKSGTEFSSFVFTLILSTYHCKVYCYYFTGENGKLGRARKRFSWCASLVSRIGLLFIVNCVRGDSLIMDWVLGRKIMRYYG